MELASAAMIPLIEKLGKLLVSKLKLEMSVRKDVASLERELKAMHVALQGVEVPPEQLDAATTHWACNLRELSYDMEDAVEAFILHMGNDDDPAAAGLRSQLYGFLNKMARLLSKGKALHRVADAVSEAKRLAKELGEINQRYAGPKQKGVGASGPSHTDIDPRLMAIYTEAADLVGIDNARDELFNILSDCSDVEVKTVSIVGFGGLGKTALVKAVYDKIKAQFDCDAFVSVSQNPNITRIFKKILHQLDKKEFKDINEAVRDVDQLIDELQRYLQNKRYLVVIDDLWDETNWKFIKCAFPKNTCSSRLVTTTRKHDVSDASCSSDGDKIYEIKPLSDDDSLKLLHSRIFQRGDRCPPELEQVSRDILKKCGGVPLAIITIASLLASRKQVKTKDQWLILLNSIGHGLQGCWNVEDMHKILSLSYYDLPSHLKPCLLYLSIFPEDCFIERDRLIWRWIAEGFIQHDNSGYDNLFEIGESYFIELVNRSMIQPILNDLDGRAEACHVHDIVLDLICFLSRKENFVDVWNKDTQTTSSHSMAVARRLSIQNNTSTRQTTNTSMSKVRSFTIFDPAIDLMPSLLDFHVVRVLDLEGCDFRKCGSQLKLRHIGDLSHLRYLGLRDTYVGKLPVEIGKLQFLQTLDVIGCTNGVQELPRTITRLRNLMRLCLSMYTKLPKGLGNLTFLEELTGVRIGGDVSTSAVKELGHLTRLRVLKLVWEAAHTGEALVQSLGNMCKLQSLEVVVQGSGRGEIICGWVPPPCLRSFTCGGSTSTLPALPAWMKNSFSLLTFLNVSVSQVGPDELQALRELPSLHGIRLFAVDRIDDGRSPAWTMVNAGAFPCARLCAFMNIATPPSMFQPGALPYVQWLEFSVWVSEIGLEDLDMGHLPSLKRVQAYLKYRKEDDAAVVERVVAALRQAAEDHPNRLNLSISNGIIDED